MGTVVREFTGVCFWANVEAWQPDPGARPRWEDKDSDQGSQSTGNGIGLAIADVFDPVGL